MKAKQFSFKLRQIVSNLSVTVSHYIHSANLTLNRYYNSLILLEAKLVLIREDTSRKLFLA